MEPRCFVIPDIHGCALTFRALLEEKIGLRPADRLYLLGDLIDRGPRTRELLDLIRDLQLRGFHIQAIRGNHEQMLLDADSSPRAFNEWLVNGGYATLDSFGVNRLAEIPARHREFIAALPYYLELDGYILVHAGFNISAPDPFQDTWTMLWSRQESSGRKKTGSRIICGHTPHSRETIRKSLGSDVITLDNGCVYRERSGLGTLAALELNTMELVFQENVD